MTKIETTLKDLFYNLKGEISLKQLDIIEDLLSNLIDEISLTKSDILKLFQKENPDLYPCLKYRLGLSGKMITLNKILVDN